MDTGTRPWLKSVMCGGMTKCRWTMSVSGFAARAWRTTPSMPRSIWSGWSGMLEESFTAASTKSRSTGSFDNTSRSKRNACGTEPIELMPAPMNSNFVWGNLA